MRNPALLSLMALGALLTVGEAFAQVRQVPPTKTESDRFPPPRPRLWAIGFALKCLGIGMTTTKTPTATLGFPWNGTKREIALAPTLTTPATTARMANGKRERKRGKIGAFFTAHCLLGEATRPFPLG